MRFGFRFSGIKMVLFFALLSLIIMLGCGGGDGEDDTSIDNNLIGWWLSFSDADCTVFEGDGFVIESDGDIVDLNCNGDENNPNCEWYQDYQDINGKVTSANNGRATIEEYDDQGGVDQYSITYAVNGNVCTINRPGYPTRYLLNITDVNNDGGSQTSYGIVRGYVYVVGTSTPISGVTVSIGSSSYTTDASGYFSLSDVPTGNQTLYAFKSDYESYSESIYVRDSNNSLTVYMTSSILTGTISGEVTYTDGSPVRGATIQIGEMIDTTDSTGQYLFPTVPQGAVQLIATNPHCEDDVQEIEIYLSSATRTYNISMRHCYFQSSETGLMWQRHYNFDLSANWNNFMDYCDMLSLEGYGDWRLPTIREILSLLDFNQSPIIDINEFPDAYRQYGSDISYPQLVSSTESASLTSVWYFWSYDEYITYQWRKYPAGGCMCVRGNSLPENSFINNGDGTVTDNGNGLVWADGAPSSGLETLAEARAYCSSLEFGDSSNWRLPSVQELISIVDYTKRNIAVDTNYFSINAERVWADSREYVVELGLGSVRSWDTTSYATSLCVRDF